MIFDEKKFKKTLDERIKYLDKRLDAVLKYISENPESDPNAYEMNNLMFLFADIGNSGRKYEKEPYEFLHDERYIKLKDKFYQMMDYRMPQFINEKNALNAGGLYEYFDVSLRCMTTLNSLGTEKTRLLLNSICGVNLYVHQRIRNLQILERVEVVYNNSSEFTNINENIFSDEIYSEISRYSERGRLVEQLYTEISCSYNKTNSEIMNDTAILQLKNKRTSSN